MATSRTNTAALLALAATLALLAGALARDTDFCYQDEAEKYLFFASKTAYEFVRNPRRGAEVLPHCTPLQIWWLNRHGTRYPGKSTIKSMAEKLPGLRDSILINHQEHEGRMCDADLEALQEWRLTVSEGQENVLTTAGEQELFLTAKRLSERFPEVLQLPYTSARYKFRHTDSQRTQESARQFAKGLFTDADAVNIPPAEKKDLLLQPYTECKVWLEGDKSDPPEWRKLVEGSLMQNLLVNVSSRLGFRHVLNFTDVDTIYDMCRFQEAWEVDKTSPWCAAFNRDELKLLEYAEDLRYYYKSGYGDEKNIKLGCPLAKDLYERFNALATAQGEQPAGVFYFAHSSTLHMLQSRLGAFRDPWTLRAENYQYLRQRAWRISLMGSFAANLGAIFYKCAPPGEPESKQVLFLAGEGPLDLPGCKVGLCTWEHVQQLLEPLAQECNLDWCDDNGAITAARLPSFPALLLALAVVLANFPSRRAV